MGHLGIFNLRKWQIRHAFKEQLEHGIPKEELSLIKIPKVWLKKAPAHFQQIEKKEFRLDGEMYDIVYQEQRLDTLWNYCIADKAESLLFAQLDDWVEEQSHEDPFQQSQTSQLERLWSSLFQIEIADLDVSIVHARASEWAPYLFNYTVVKADLISPPPEFFS